MALGFKGEIEINGTKVEENQFIDVGIGVHARTLVHLLKKHKIKFEMVDKQRLKYKPDKKLLIRCDIGKNYYYLRLREHACR